MIGCYFLIHLLYNIREVAVRKPISITQCTELAQAIKKKFPSVRRATQPVRCVVSAFNSEVKRTQIYDSRCAACYTAIVYQQPYGTNCLGSIFVVLKLFS